MAKHEADREDLIAEATALVQRAEIAYQDDDGNQQAVVIGFRRDGAMSCYFGAEPVYQFNTQHQLRRAYFDGMMLKAESGRLVAMRRVRAEGALQLLSSPLAVSDQEFQIRAMNQRLLHLVEALAHGTATILRQVPDAGDPRGDGLADRIAKELQQTAAKGEIAQRPNV